MSAYGCAPSCTTRPSLHPLYPTLPACNVTIHNRCKDTLANCTKVKQKVRWQGGQRAGGEGTLMPFSFIPYPVFLSPLLTVGQPRPSTPDLRPELASLLLETYLPGTGLSHPDDFSHPASFRPRWPAAQLLPCAMGVTLG